MPAEHELRLAIDIGGTFTDIVLMRGRETVLATAKTATTPTDPSLGALEGARLVLAEANAKWGDVTSFIHGTTLATNALIERRGATVATVTNAGFRDILEIAYERRYTQYAINIEKPDLIVPRTRAFTVPGRIDAKGLERQELAETDIDQLAQDIRSSGADAIAICLLHAYANPTHERRLRDMLQSRLPEAVISVSHEVSPEAREFDRLCTTVANAYVQPLMSTYLANLRTRFADQGLDCPILMMTASGGMTTIETASRLPVRLVESGPAGGAILAAQVAEQLGEDQVLSFDMGGTTAKLCLIDSYRPQTARTFEVSRAERFIKGSGMPVRIPVVEMIEIGAGGGSVAAVDRLGRLQVGPQSAGAEPGPAGFGKGGTAPTVTDADIALGLINPDRFAEGRIAIDEDLAITALATDVAQPLGLEPVGAAFGISEIVDENMASAGRMHAVESGKDLGTRTMIAFGGNGPLHATRVARRARVRRIIVPTNPGVGSAVGFVFAPISFEIVRSRYMTLDDLDFSALNALFDDMHSEAHVVVRAGAPDGILRHNRSAFMRYRGQGHEIEITLPPRHLTADDVETLREAFEAEYRRQFVRIVPDMKIEILNWAISVSSAGPPNVGQLACTATRHPDPVGQRTITCDLTGEPRTAALFDRACLSPGDAIAGPALIMEPQTTTFVSADFSATVDSHRNIVLTAIEEARS
ncbi:MAG: hydantoinase/oxoprolinase family protein [Pseudomonadota bacterium]